MYEEQLKGLGLTDNEIKIYLLLLQKGALNPYSISEDTGFHRGYIYDSLEKMQEKGVVNTILIKNKKHYQANDPEILLETLNEKLKNLKSIIPNLKDLENKKNEDTKVELHKGKYVYQTLIKDVIKTLESKNKTIYLIGIDEEILEKEIEPIYIKQYLNNLKVRKIKEKIIIKKGLKKQKYSSLDYKEIDEKYIGNTAQIIYGNKVAIFILGTPNYLTIIENQEVAKTYIKQFEALWNIK